MKKLHNEYERRVLRFRLWLLWWSYNNGVWWGFFFRDVLSRLDAGRTYCALSYSMYHTMCIRCMHLMGTAASLVETPHRLLLADSPHARQPRPPTQKSEIIILLGTKSSPRESVGFCSRMRRHQVVACRPTTRDRLSRPSRIFSNTIQPYCTILPPPRSLFVILFILHCHRCTSSSLQPQGQ